MNKKNIIYLIIILAIIISFGVYFYFKSSNSSKTVYDADKTTISKNNIINENSNSSTSNNTSNPSNTSSQNTVSKETEISTFSTTLYSKDSERQHNIQLTCSSLNGTIVKSGETFSFCSTIGPATSDKGYQKADIFDNKGNKKKGYGGGNCQISSTLYNAVMAVPNLEIIERHPHSNKVPYVKKDKDAAVAYGSYDFKFKNNTGNDIRILAGVDSSCVTTSLWSIPK
ncbi:MAG: VanW family protein [Clostridia bacterium]